jgi:hypothetical protein
MSAPTGSGDHRIVRDGTQAFHRRHELRALDAATVVAAVEDDMHHFELTLRHDGRVVTAVDGRAVRWPWAPCTDGARAVDALVGMPLDTSSSAVGAWTDATTQCTHQFDLAGLAVAHAARHAAGGAPTRSYLAVVPDWEQPPYHAWILRDGVEVLRFTIDGRTVAAPEPFAGVALDRRFIQWCSEHLDDDTAEAALLLRRAAWMSPARHIDLESYAMVGDTLVKPGVCFATQPQRLSIGFRNRDSLRDYGDRPDALLASFRAAHDAGDAADHDDHP